jgi:hypothetical protein
MYRDVASAVDGGISLSIGETKCISTLSAPTDVARGDFGNPRDTPVLRVCPFAAETQAVGFDKN